MFEDPKYDAVRQKAVAIVLENYEKASEGIELKVDEPLKYSREQLIKPTKDSMEDSEYLAEILLKTILKTPKYTLPNELQAQEEEKEETSKKESWIDQQKVKFSTIMENAKIWLNGKVGEKASEEDEEEN